VKGNISRKDADLHRHDTRFLMLMLNWFQDLVKGNISGKDADLHRHDTTTIESECKNNKTNNWRMLNSIVTDERSVATVVASSFAARKIISLN
jgi:hypothetical protein